MRIPGGVDTVVNEQTAVRVVYHIGDGKIVNDNRMNQTDKDAANERNSHRLKAA